MIVKIPKRDSDESCNNQELSGRYGYAIINGRDLIINMHEQKNDDKGPEGKELATSKLKKARRESEEIYSGQALVSVPSHIAID